MDKIAAVRVVVIEPANATARRALVDGGFDVVHLHVTSESDALGAAGKGPFDVVLIDLDVPKLDSLALMRRVRETSPAASVVWLTARATNEVAVRAAELGVLQVLAKPAKADALRRIVAAGVRHTREQLSMIRAVMQPATEPRAVSATDAKNEFGNVLEDAVRSGAVLITKHDVPRAVLVSVDRLGQVMARHEPDLQALTQEFDDVVAKMRTPAAKAAARGLFSANVGEFGAAAVSAAAQPRALKKRAAKRTKRSATKKQRGG